jgi:hypothetical protein
MAEERIPDPLRRLVAERARYYCEYCRSQVAYAMQPFSVEHVVPHSRGGLSEEVNLALSCQGCNNHKYIKTAASDPLGGAVVPLFNPRTQKWRDHFLWSNDATHVLGISPTGRDTVVALRLNRDGVVNLRRLLFEHGLHPPSEPE